MVYDGLKLKLQLIIIVGEEVFLIPLLRRRTREQGRNNEAPATEGEARQKSDGTTRGAGCGGGSTVRAADKTEEGENEEGGEAEREREKFKLGFAGGGSRRCGGWRKVVVVMGVGGGWWCCDGWTKTEGRERECKKQGV